MQDEIRTHLKQAKEAARKLRQVSPEIINKLLKDIAQALLSNQDLILEANQKDLDRMDEQDPKYDRLKLTSERIESIAVSIEQVSCLESPLGQNFDAKTLENGLSVHKTKIPIGVLGMIYEARPNVTVDAFSIGFKTKNVVCLKGGSDAKDSNEVLVKLIQEVLQQHDLPISCIYLLPADREAVKVLLQADEYVDVIIPRGSQGLIKFVRENSKVPVIETGAGVVHTYFDALGDTEKAKKIILSAKARRPSVCNALDCLLIHKDRLSDLAELVHELENYNVHLFAEEKALASLTGHYKSELLSPAKAEHFGTEFLGFQAVIKTVESLEEACDHIYQYSSGHSDAIITEDQTSAEYFLNQIDSACVFWNTETGFSDGEQLGLGAEIGISTQKLHARGPMALEAMTTYKWVIVGEGQVRM